MMNRHVRRYLWSLLAAFILTLPVVALAFYGPKSSDIVAVLFLPGMMAAGIVFLGGVHSDWATAYLILAMILEVFFFSWPVFGLVVLAGRLRKHKSA